MAAMQDGILDDAAFGKCHLGKLEVRRAMVVRGLVWAFTRVERHYLDRLVYKAFASDLLDAPCHVAQRRQPAPVDFASLSRQERHVSLTRATVLTGPQNLRWMFCRSPRTWQADLATLEAPPTGGG
jgi:hypothetical protein